LDIAKYTAAIMRKVWLIIDKKSAQYTQSLVAGMDFIGPQKLLRQKAPMAHR